MFNIIGKSRAELVALRTGHLNTIDDILKSGIFITTPTARLLVSAIKLIDARINVIDAGGD